MITSAFKVYLLAGCLGLLWAQMGFAHGEDPEGFLSLRSTQSYNSSSGLFDKSLPLMGRADVGQSFGAWNFTVGASYQESGVLPWTREDTRLIYEDHERGLRWRLGDINITPRGFQRADSVGGLSVQKELDADSNRTAYRLSVTELYLRRDSIVDIFVNGFLYSHQRLASGVLDLRADPLLLGQSRVHVQVRDDLGEEEQFDFDLLFLGSSLKEGHQEFSYESGAPWRIQKSERTYRQEALLTSIYHRYGLTDHTTIGFNFQNWTYRYLFGLEASESTSFGVFFFDFGQSDIGGVRGTGLRLTWKNPELTDFNWFWGVEYERRSDSFFIVSVDGLPAVNFLSRGDILLSRSITPKLLGFAGLTLEEGFTSNYNRQIGRVGARYQFSGQTQIEVTGFHTDGFTREERGLLTFTWSEEPPRFVARALADSTNRRNIVEVEHAPAEKDPTWKGRALGSNDTLSTGGELTLDGLIDQAQVRLDYFTLNSPGNVTSRNRLGLDSGFRWSANEGFLVSRPKELADKKFR